MGSFRSLSIVLLSNNNDLSHLCLVLETFVFAALLKRKPLSWFFITQNSGRWYLLKESHVAFIFIISLLPKHKKAPISWSVGFGTIVPVHNLDPRGKSFRKIPFSSKSRTNISGCSLVSCFPFYSFPRCFKLFLYYI